MLDPWIPQLALTRHRAKVPTNPWWGADILALIA